MAAIGQRRNGAQVLDRRKKPAFYLDIRTILPLG
jgi:hypothetical protein